MWMHAAVDLKRRKDLISKVVSYNGEPANYFEELRVFGWDCDHDLVTLKKNDIHRVLALFSAGEITVVQLTRI